MYEQIPTIMTDAVRSLYRERYVDLLTISPARLFDFIDTNSFVGGLKTLLSQVGLIATIVFVGVIVFIRIQKSALKPAVDVSSESLEPSSLPEPSVGVLRDRWNTLLAHLDSTHESQWKVAVMEADKLVDDALAKAGYPGATFGDRLSNIQPGALVSLDGIWWAHKIRNRLAHEVDYFLRYTEARQAIGYYQAALSELQLI